MTLVSLVQASFARNPVRSWFTFAAITTAFALFGALQTIDYQHDLPPADADIVIVSKDGAGGLSPSAMQAIAGLHDVLSLSGMRGVPVRDPTSESKVIPIFGMDGDALPTTIRSLGITPEIARQWRQQKAGAISDQTTARQAGWKVGDRIAMPLILGMKTTSGADHLELTLLAIYGRSIVSGVIVRRDFLRDTFAFADGIDTAFVRVRNAQKAGDVADAIDNQFRGSSAETHSIAVGELDLRNMKNATTLRTVMRGAVLVSFFTMVLIVTSALAQTVRERAGELAVLQAVGYQRRTLLFLLLSEAGTLFVLGALTGLVLAWAGFQLGWLGLPLERSMLPLPTVMSAAMYVCACALVSTALPCWEFSRLPLAAALARM
ncbi:MAG TPA: ABC transporter permease [Steroidobacteraceae bacterium]|jgi:putative ABC transport system permease protein